MDWDEEEQYVNKMAHKNPNDLTHRDWLWLHPSAYSLIYYGVNWLAFGMFGGGVLFCWWKGLPIGMIITGLMILASVRYVYMQRKIKKPEGMTFYKTWLVTE